VFAAVCLVLVTAFLVESARGQPHPVERAEIVHPGPRLNAPNFFALTVDPMGRLFVGGANSSNVLRVAPRGNGSDLNAGDPPCVTEILSQEKAEAQGVVFAAPKGIAIGSDGTVYVAGTGGSANVNDNLVSVSPDGTITELASRSGLIRADWNPAGVAIEESDEGTFVYAVGPAPNTGVVVRVAPDRTVAQLMKMSGQGLVVDETGTLYFSQIGDDIVRSIPDAKHGVCSTEDPNGKECPALITGISPGGQALEASEMDCDGQPVTLDGPYGLALGGGILYVVGQNSRNVLRRPLRPDNVLGLPLCTQQIFVDGDSGLPLQTPRAIAADNAGNVYAVGNRSDNVIWIRPDPADNTKVIPQQIVTRDNGLASPQAAAVDNVGNFYVSGLFTNNVIRVRTVNAGQPCGNGKHEAGELCDYALDCCCSLTCDLAEAGDGCREAAGDCDLSDVCDGETPKCTDDRRGNDVVCRPSAGLCDIDDRCDGGVNCPDNVFKSSGTNCRPAKDICDVPESCTGTGPDCPLDGVLALDTVCREAQTSCDPPERCDGVSNLCPEDVFLASRSECSLSPEAVRGTDPACLEDAGACDANHVCQPVPRTGSPCVPAGMDRPDLSCIRSATCDAAGLCEVVVEPDGESCGNFCENTECMAGKCVARPGPHPCGGSDIEHCDALQIGRECVQCGDGVVEPPEACDDGNQLGNDGCTERCQLACDPTSAQACTPPLLDEKVTDPCRKNECKPVHLNPRVENEGFACVTVTFGCTGCLSDLECSPSDSCHVARCDQHTCVNDDMVGLARATCGFSDVFPGAGSACAETQGKNKAKTLARISKLEANARKMVESTVCSAGVAKPKAHAMRQIRHLLRLAVFRANALRTPFREKITQDCENLLTARFDRLLDNLEAAATSGWSCSASGGSG
jgi:cysteine-rich repeat protein